jgi:hypothetical protein
MTDRIIPKIHSPRACGPTWQIATAFFVALLVIGAGVGSEARATERIDVIFVLDNSGSMREHDPEYRTRRAVRDFASALSQDSSLDGRVGVVLFDQEARLVFSLTDITQQQTQREPNAEISMLSRALDALNFSGQ